MMPTDDEAHKQLRSRARHGVLWLASTTVVWQLVNWLLTILTARYLLPADYGVMALADTVLSYLWIVASLGTNAWLLQTQDHSVRAVRTIWTLQLVLGLLILLGGVACAPGLARFYSSEDLELPFRLLVIAFLLHSVWSMEELLLQRDLQFKRVSLVNLAITLLRGVVQLTLAMMGLGVLALVLGILVREIAAICFYLPGILRRLRLAWDGRILGEALRFGLPITGSSILWVIANTADNITVGKLFGEGMLGLYAMAFYLTDLPLSKLNTVVRPVLIPYLVKLRADGSAAAREMMRRAHLQASQSLMLVVAPSLIGLALLAKELTELLLGSGWMGLVPYLQLMCLVGLLRALVDNISPMFQALGKPMPHFVHNLISAIVLPAAFVIGGERWGVSGVFGTWLWVFPLLSILLLWLLKFAGGASPLQYMINLLPPLCAGCVMALAVSGVQIILPYEDPLLRVIICMVLGAVVYFAALRIAFPHVIVGLREFIRSAENPNA